MTFLHVEKVTPFLFDSSMCWSDFLGPPGRSEINGVEHWSTMCYSTCDSCSVPTSTAAAKRKDCCGSQRPGATIESVMRNNRYQETLNQETVCRTHVSEKDPKLGRNLPQQKPKAVHASVTRWICRRFRDLQSTAAASFCIWWLDLEEARSAVILYISNVYYILYTYSIIHQHLIHIIPWMLWPSKIHRLQYLQHGSWHRLKNLGTLAGLQQKGCFSSKHQDKFALQDTPFVAFMALISPFLNRTTFLSHPHLKP